MTEWKALRVAVVGNFNPVESGRRYQAEVLSDAFASEGARVERITTEQNRWIRPVATFKECVAASGRYDVACVQTFSNRNFLNGAIAIVVGRLLGKHVVVVYRGGAAPQFLDRLGWLIVPVLRLAHRLVVPSGYLEAVFRDRGFVPIVIPNVIDLGAIPFRRRQTFEPKLVWVRHLRAGYNPGLALEVLARLQQRWPRASLTLVGEGVARPALEKEVRWRGLAGVTFAGQQPQKEVFRRLDANDIFISTTNYDNQPRSLLEAMAAGLPVVSTNVGGVPYLVEDGANGLLVPPNDAAAMTRAVSAVLEDSELGMRLTRCARERLEAFTWESARSRWIQVLREPSER